MLAKVTLHQKQTSALTYYLRKRLNQARPIVDSNTDRERSDCRDKNTPPKPFLAPDIVTKLLEEQHKRELDSPNATCVQQVDRDLRVKKQGQLIVEVRRRRHRSILDGDQCIH